MVCIIPYSAIIVDTMDFIFFLNSYVIYKTEITIPIMIMLAQKNLYPTFFSLNINFPDKIVTIQQDCLISVIIVILLSVIPFAMNNALSPMINIMLSIQIQ